MKKVALALLIAASFVGLPGAALADDDPLPPGCEYVLGKLICVDMPIEP